MQSRFLQMDAASPSQPNGLLEASARALALFFSGFTLLNLIGDACIPGFDANLWWIDLRMLPEWAANLLLAIASLCLGGFGMRLPRSPWRRRLTAGVVTTLAAVVFWNVVEYYALLARGGLRVLVPAPLSFFIFAALIVIFAANARGNLRPYCGTKIRRQITVMLLVCLGIFPLAQILCFGKTDYRRSADVAVVFGARAYKDGHPSDALGDRVKTACQRYRDGLVKKLIFSGGPGDGAFTESQVMRRLAIASGVKPGDILTDDLGLNTQATVKNSEALFGQLKAKRILVVSHFYHLPRIKLAYHRAGFEVYTVPAKETRFLGLMPYFVAREVVALWAYYLRPLA